MITSAVENKVLMLPAEGKIQAFNTKDNVFQRNLPHRPLCVGGIGIDDDKIILFNRKVLIFNQIIPRTLFNIAKLSKIVHMRQAGPVVFINGMRDIQKLCINRINFPGFQGVSCNRHKFLLYGWPVSFSLYMQSVFPFLFRNTALENGRITMESKHLCKKDV